MDAGRQSVPGQLNTSKEIVMMEYLAGFATCAALWAGFHFGFVQPRIKALKALAAARLKEGVKEFKGRFGG